VVVMMVIVSRVGGDRGEGDSRSYGHGDENFLHFVFPF